MGAPSPSLLEGFFQALEARWEQLPLNERTPLGIAERLRTEAAVRLEGPWSMFRLREALRACLVRSRAQDEAFEQAFIDCFGALSREELCREFHGPLSREEVDRALARRPGHVARWHKPLPPRGLPDPTSAPRPVDRRWLAAGLVGVLVLAFVVWNPTQAVKTGQPGTKAPKTETWPSPGDASGKGDPTPPVEPLPSQGYSLEQWKRESPKLPPRLRVEKVEVLASSIRQLHLFLLLGSAVALVALLGWVYRGRWPPRREWRLAPGPSSHAPFLLQPGPEDGPEPHLTEAELDRLASALTWTQSPPERPTLDVMASVKATARRGGFPTIVPRKERRLRKILVLADTETEVLRERHLDEELASGLARRGLPVMLARWSDSLASFRVDGSPVRDVLEGLPRQEVVLLVLSDARGLVDLEAELHRLGDFSHKAWIDPRDPSVWGTDALRIAQRVPLMAPNAEGWARLRRVLGGEGLEEGEALPVLSVRARLEARDPGVAAEARPFSPAEARRLEAALGPALPWACALATLPLPMPGGYAYRVLRQLRTWAEGPDGEAHPGVRASLRALGPLSLDRLRALPGVQSANGRIGFDGPLARFLVHEVLAPRWPRLYRRALELHEAMLEGAVQRQDSLAELERQAALAMVQWQLAVLDYQNDGRKDADRRSQADRRLRDAALTLRSLQRSRLQGWAHAFMSAGVRGRAFLPEPAQADIPPRLLPWVRSAMAGAEAAAWTPNTLKLGGALVFMLAVTWFTQYLGREEPRIQLQAVAPTVSLKDLQDAAWVDQPDGRHLFVRTVSGPSDLGRLPELKTGESLRVTLAAAPGTPGCVDTETHKDLGVTVLRCAPPIRDYTEPDPPRPGNLFSTQVGVATPEQIGNDAGLRMARRLLSSSSVALVIGRPPGEDPTSEAAVQTVLQRELLATPSPDDLRFHMNRLKWTSDFTLSKGTDTFILSPSSNLPPAAGEWFKNLVYSAPPCPESARDRTFMSRPSLELILRSYPMAPVRFSCTRSDGQPAACTVSGRYADESAGPNGEQDFSLSELDSQGAARRCLAQGPWSLKAVCPNGLRASPASQELVVEAAPKGAEFAVQCLTTPPAPQPPVVTDSVLVSLALPEGHTARLDGKPLDRGEFRVRPGEHRLDVSAGCVAPWSFAFQVTPDGSLQSAQPGVLRKSMSAGVKPLWEMDVPALEGSTLSVDIQVPPAARKTLKRLQVTVGNQRRGVDDLDRPRVSFQGLDCGRHPVVVLPTRTSPEGDLDFQWTTELKMSSGERDHQVTLPEGFFFLGQPPLWLELAKRAKAIPIFREEKVPAWFIPVPQGGPLHLKTTLLETSNLLPDTAVIDTQAWPLLTGRPLWAELGSRLYLQGEQPMLRAVGVSDRSLSDAEEQARRWVLQAQRSMHVLNWNQDKMSAKNASSVRNLLSRLSTIEVNAKLLDKTRDSSSQRWVALVEQKYLGTPFEQLSELPREVKFPSSTSADTGTSSPPEWVDRAWREQPQSRLTQFEALGVGAGGSSSAEMTAARIQAKLDLFRQSRESLPLSVSQDCWTAYLFENLDQYELPFEYSDWVGQDATFVRLQVFREQLNELAMRKCGPLPASAQ